MVVKWLNESIFKIKIIAVIFLRFPSYWKLNSRKSLTSWVWGNSINLSKLILYTSIIWRSRSMQHSWMQQKPCWVIMNNNKLNVFKAALGSHQSAGRAMWTKLWHTNVCLEKCMKRKIACGIKIKNKTLFNAGFEMALCITFSYSN